MEEPDALGFALASPFDFSFDFSEVLDLSDCEDVACGVIVLRLVCVHARLLLDRQEHHCPHTQPRHPPIRADPDHAGLTGGGSKTISPWRRPSAT